MGRRGRGDRETKNAKSKTKCVCVAEWTTIVVLMDGKVAIFAANWS